MLRSTFLFLASFAVLTAKLSADADCPFCKPSIVEGQSFYEGTEIHALVNFKPQLQGHSLIIPKRHVERLEELSASELLEMHAFIRRLSAAFHVAYEAPDFFLALQNGKKAGQTVPHVHFHVIPRKESNVWTKLRLWLHYMMAWTSVYPPLSQEQMDLEIARLRAALEEVGEMPSFDHLEQHSWQQQDEAI